jgi:hypothetical protein
VVDVIDAAIQRQHVSKPSGKGSRQPSVGRHHDKANDPVAPPFGPGD